MQVDMEHRESFERCKQAGDIRRLRIAQVQQSRWHVLGLIFPNRDNGKRVQLWHSCHDSSAEFFNVFDELCVKRKPRGVTCLILGGRRRFHAKNLQIGRECT